MRQIAETKLPDLNARDLDQAVEDHRGHRALDGSGGRLMASGKRYRELYEKVDREKVYEPADAIALVKELQSAKFAETVECHIRTGPQRPPRRRAAARHDLAAARRGPRADGRGVRQGRQGARGRGGRRRHRGRRGPRQADRGGLHRLRRGHRHAGHDARGRPPRPHPRPAGQDAEPEGGHRHRRRGPGGHRVEGRADGVPHRPLGDRPPARSARRTSTSAPCSRTTPP